MWSLTRFILALLLIGGLVIFGVAALPATAATSTNPTYGLGAITNMDNLGSLQPGVKFGGNSSYDRTGGNADFNNFLPPVNGEKVMLNQTGPGTVLVIRASSLLPQLYCQRRQAVHAQSVLSFGAITRAARPVRFFPLSAGREQQWGTSDSQVHALSR